MGLATLRRLGRLYGRVPERFTCTRFLTGATSSKDSPTTLLVPCRYSLHCMQYGYARKCTHSPAPWLLTCSAEAASNIHRQAQHIYSQENDAKCVTKYYTPSFPIPSHSSPNPKILSHAEKKKPQKLLAYITRFFSRQSPFPYNLYRRNSARQTKCERSSSSLPLPHNSHLHFPICRSKINSQRRTRSEAQQLDVGRTISNASVQIKRPCWPLEFLKCG
jgi:hypothetical protein